MDPATAALVYKMVEQEVNKREKLKADMVKLQRIQDAIDAAKAQSPALAAAAAGAAAAETGGKAAAASCAPTPATPQHLNLDEGDMSRGSSISSYSSSCSTPRSAQRPLRCPPRPTKSKRLFRELLFRDPLHEEESQLFDEDAEELTPAQQLRDDRRNILRPCLQYFDHLLWERNSILFKRQHKKQLNADGTRSLKKNESLNLRLWSQLVRKFLRKFMGVGYMNNHNLVSRFRYAAKKIVCKRRANHLYSWRTKNTHKALIYGDGSEPLTKTPMGPLPRKRKRKINFERKQKRARPSSSSCFMPENMDVEEEFEQAGFCSDTTVNYSGETDVADNFDDSDDSGDENSVAAAPAAKKQAPPVSNMRKCTTSCIECGAKVTYNTCFPRDNEDWTPELPKKVRCGDCWDRFVQKDVMGEMAERIEKQSSKIGAKKKKTKAKSKANEMPKKKRKRTKRTQCRCGSKTHLTTACLDCPYNKRNLRKQTSADAAPAPDTPDNTAPAPDTPTNATAPAPDTPTNATAPAPDTPDNATASAPTTPNVANPVTSTTPTIPTFTPKVGDNVFALWKRREWYLAHITAIVGDRYEVYFVEDSKTKKNLRLNQLRTAPLVTHGLGSMRRGSLVTNNAVWFFDGAPDLAAGNFMVRAIGIEPNTYRCERQSGGGPGVQDVEDFDIGYVMRTIRDAKQALRQR